MDSTLETCILPQTDGAEARKERAVFQEGSPQGVETFPQIYNGDHAAQGCLPNTCTDTLSAQVWKHKAHISPAGLKASRRAAVPAWCSCSPSGCPIPAESVPGT